MFWKLLASQAALTLGALLVLAAFFSRAYESLLTRELDGLLRAAATSVSQLLAERWPVDSDAALQATIQRIGEQSGVRRDGDRP